MKNVIVTSLLLIVLCSTLSAQSQTPNDSIAAPRYVYCSFTDVSVFFGRKVNIAVDYGQQWSTDSIYWKDKQTQKDMEFNSEIDALNYMTSQGWEFVQTYVEVGNNVSTTRWLLRKRVVPKKD
jgi:hypothetical protein